DSVRPPEHVHRRDLLRSEVALRHPYGQRLGGVDGAEDGGIGQREVGRKEGHQVIAKPIVVSALLACAGTAVPCFAQEPPVAPPKPVATDDQMLHKYVWSTIGLDGALGATVAGSLDQWKRSPPEWSMDAKGFTRRWVSDYAETAIGDGAKYTVAHFFHQD